MKTRLHSPHSPSFSVERAGRGETSSHKIELPDQPTFPVHLGDRYAQVARPPPPSLTITWACGRCQPRCKRAQNGGVDDGHALLRPAGPPGWAGLFQNTYGDYGSIAASASGTVAWAAAWTVAQRACPGQRPASAASSAVCPRSALVGGLAAPPCGKIFMRGPQPTRPHLGKVLHHPPRRTC